MREKIKNWGGGGGGWRIIRESDYSLEQFNK